VAIAKRYSFTSKSVVEFLLVPSRRLVYLIIRLVYRFIAATGLYDAVKSAGAGEYTPHYPYTYSTYSPWFEGPFRKIYDKIKDRSLVSEDRCYILHRLCLHCLHFDGHFCECGVYKGSTAFLIARVIKEHPTKKHNLHLFDTFTGMPDTAIKERDSHSKGDAGDTSLEDVKEFLKEFTFIEFHPGFIPDTFKEIVNRRFCFVHIDVDIYQSTIDCYRFFYDRMVRGGILLCDDYGFPAYRKAAKAAVDQFFSGKPEVPIVLPTGQCLVIKL
jgi:O-methyltransferase